MGQRDAKSSLTIKIVFTVDTDKSVYEELLSRNEGEIFKIEGETGEHETVLLRVANLAAQSTDFTYDFIPINPGTQLFTNYGPGHYFMKKY